MRAVGVKCLLLMVICWIPADASRLEIPLKYHRRSERQRGFYAYGYGSIQTSDACPAGEWRLPDFKSPQPVYGIIELAGRRRLLVLDRRDGGDDFYTRLYFDSNGNRDLTDDPAIDGSIEKREDQLWQRYELIFPPVDTKVDIGGRWVPYAFRPHVYYSGKTSGGRLSGDGIRELLHIRYEVYCWYSGQFEVGERRFTVGFGDRNANGRFDDALAVPNLAGIRHGDGIPVEADRIYLADRMEISHYDGYVCGNWLIVGENVYRLTIDIPGEKMVLDPVTEGLASLRLAMNVDRMTLFTDDGRNCLLVVDCRNPMMIPEGRYRLLDYVSARKDKEGDLWRLSARGTKDSPVLKVSGLGLPVLKLGEPFRPLVNVPQWASAERGYRSEVSLRLRVEGEANEVVDDIRHIEGQWTRISRSSRSRSRPKEPGYEIFEASGRRVKSGSFEYG